MEYLVLIQNAKALASKLLIGGKFHSSGASHTVAKFAKIYFSVAVLVDLQV
jgi:hypothetical protein